MSVQMSCQGGMSGNLLREHRQMAHMPGSCAWSTTRRGTVPSQGTRPGLPVEALAVRAWEGSGRRGRPHSLRAGVFWTKSWILFRIQWGSHIGFKWQERWLCAGVGTHAGGAAAGGAGVRTRLVDPSASGGHSRFYQLAVGTHAAVTWCVNIF